MAKKKAFNRKLGPCAFELAEFAKDRPLRTVLRKSFREEQILKTIFKNVEPTLK